MKKYLTLAIIIFIATAVAALEVTQQVTVTVLPGEINIFSPAQNALYTARQVPINLSMNTEVKFFKYADNGKNLKTLCRNCAEYGFSRTKRKPFDDGFHQLEIQGIFEQGTISHYINFTVDTKKPRIQKTSPTSGFTDGLFEVQFQEDNPKELFINYGNELEMKNSELNLASCAKDRTKTLCTIALNLSEFSEQEIQYWFNITDIAGNSDKSKINKISVDQTPPRINEFSHIQSGRAVTFTIDVTEPNFEEINYIDIEDKNTKPKKLCSSLKNGICEKKRTFRKGAHNLTIEAVDEAGNRALVAENLVFSVK